MKSNVLQFPTQAIAQHAFEAFFETLDSPAALCDAALTILVANSSFEVLCGSKDVVGHSLTDFLSKSLTCPADGRSLDVETVTNSEQALTLTLSRRGQTVAVVARRLTPVLDSLAAAGRALIEQARLETELLEIGRTVAGATSEEQLVATVAKGVRNLFPKRAFSVRMIDPHTSQLTSLYAEGNLKETERETIYLRRSMVQKTQLDTRKLPSSVKVIQSELPLIFEGSVRAIAAPLVASGELVGAINVEYPPGLSADFVTDERVLIQLANQVAVAVRNVKLIDELTFMRKYLEDLLENANALIWVVNPEGKTVVFNSALARLTGFTRDQILDRDFGLLIPESERFKFARALADSMKGHQASNFEAVLLAKEGHDIKVTLATSSVLSQGQKSDGVIFIGYDLTKIRELEKRVIQAEKLASLGQLAASVAHEINNPMTAVTTYAEASIHRAETAGEMRDIEKFKRILENSERVLRFTHGLVSYSRPAHDKPEDVDVSPLVERALGYCEHVVKKHNVTLSADLGAGLKIRAVKQNMVQVLVNLITNACHASKANGAVLVATRADETHVVISVSDDGHGMTQETKSKIFEPFFSTKPDGQGTGLGLSIVQSVVEKHGGTIVVESTTGRGTVFEVRLPLIQS
jgi:two-component system, NtrC family, sensor kinase